MNWIIFWLGCAGAAAPEVLRLYALRAQPEKYTWSWSYVIVSGVFGALGGLVAVFIAQATTTVAAFYAGLSMPVVISAAAKKLGAEPDASTKGAASTGQLRMGRLHSFFDAL